MCNDIKLVRLDNTFGRDDRALHQDGALGDTSGAKLVRTYMKIFSYLFSPCWLFICEGILFCQLNLNDPSYHSQKNNNSVTFLTRLTMVILFRDLTLWITVVCFGAT